MNQPALPISGLSSAEAKERLSKHGKNLLVPEKKKNPFTRFLNVLAEPMFLLLLAAALVYFILGEARDGAIMLIFVVGIMSIEFFQEWKTDRTLEALKELSGPHITVIRDGKETAILSEDLVPGDLMLIHEGIRIPADGKILSCADLQIDESSLTGESTAVWKTQVTSDTTEIDVKDEHWGKDHCYAGTLVLHGTATILVEQTGAKTEYGKIGLNVSAAEDEKSPLQKQIDKLVKISAIVAGILMLTVALFTWFNISDHPFKERLTESILSGVTLAMAMIPEEFPVILTVFLSMGAWRLAKKKSLVRNLKSVETLGSVSVLCVDKTGTITMNQMKVQEIAPFKNTEETLLLETMALACESEAYDPMEKAMLAYCNEKAIDTAKLFEREFLHDYPFTNETKMMGHVWKINKKPFIAAKGSPEKIMPLCNLSAEDQKEAENTMRLLAKKGLRVIAVAYAGLDNLKALPASLENSSLHFLGLVGLEDPPRESVKNDIALCQKAGVRVVMITGDSAETALAIAKKVGICQEGVCITGNMIQNMTQEELCEAVKEVSVFSRVLPEHKMNIIKAFQESGEIVAMTGDGVNDAPALKHANIGIAMGKRGSEVAREAADLILMDDNFTTIVETIKDGRRIYDNIRKAVGYVFAIHLPIALASLLGPFLGIPSASLMLLPLHVVLMEVLIDPTCSIVLERQPPEPDIMDRKPRDPSESIVTSKKLFSSLLQGFVIFLASFGLYYSRLSSNPENSALARSAGLTVMILANLFLVMVVSSEKEYAFQTLKKLLKDNTMRSVFVATPVFLLVILYTPLASYLKLEGLSFELLAKSALLAFLSVFWYEILKIAKPRNTRKTQIEN
ncbi:MAG: cation-translocating P-type ATPase [Candidatus Riflebacteria bacterium]|nr:cation-translocating P-type ATPase [Candidatus Riflebacteria bacterium]